MLLFGHPDLAGCTVHRHWSSQCSGAWSCIQSWVVIQQELPLYRQHETDLSAAVSASGVLSLSQLYLKIECRIRWNLAHELGTKRSPFCSLKISDPFRRSPTQFSALRGASLSLSLSIYRQVLGDCSSSDLSGATADTISAGGKLTLWASNHWVNSVKLTV